MRPILVAVKPTNANKGITMLETSSIDKLFLELSQFTQATTESELKLIGALHEIKGHLLLGDNDMAITVVSGALRQITK